MTIIISDEKGNEEILPVSPEVGIWQKILAIILIFLPLFVIVFVIVFLITFSIIRGNWGDFNLDEAFALDYKTLLSWEPIQ